MFPLILDLQKTSILLVGNGPATARRKVLLQEAGLRPKHLETLSDDFELRNVDILLVADFDEETSKHFYQLGKKAGALVNVEDKIAYCDFHVPAIVRRGDLLISVSTGGKSPRVARRIRMMLENLFTKSWEGWLAELGNQREQWKKEHLSVEELAKRTDAFLDKNTLLKASCECLKKAA